MAVVLYAVCTVAPGADVPIAMVTDLQGKASVTDAGKSRDATILAELAAGAQVQ